MLVFSKFNIRLLYSLFLSTPNAMIAMEGFDVNDEEGDNIEFEDEIIFSSSDENDDSDEFSN